MLGFFCQTPIRKDRTIKAPDTWGSSEDEVTYSNFPGFGYTSELSNTPPPPASPQASQLLLQLPLPKSQSQSAIPKFDVQWKKKAPTELEKQESRNRLRAYSLRLDPSLLYYYQKYLFIL